MITPDLFGLPRCDLKEVQGGDATTNARLLEGILSGEIQGAMRHMTQLNAAAALVMTKKAEDLAGGIDLAGEIIERGDALKKLRALQSIG